VNEPRNPCFLPVYWYWRNKNTQVLPGKSLHGGLLLCHVNIAMHDHYTHSLYTLKSGFLFFLHFKSCTGWIQLWIPTLIIVFWSSSTLTTSIFPQMSVFLKFSMAFVFFLVLCIFLSSSASSSRRTFFCISFVASSSLSLIHTQVS